MPEPTADFGDLVNRWKAGDRAAWNKLWQVYYSQLERMARKRLNQDFSRLRNRGIETGDILGDAVRQMLKRLNKEGELERLTTEKDFFLMAASYIRWACLNIANRLGKRKTGPLPDLPEPGTRHPCSLEDMVEFHTQVDNMPKDLKETFDLVFFCAMTFEQAARLLGVHRDTVKRRYRRGWEYLEKALKE